MKINKLRVNGFGKIKDKEIDLGNNINLIFGKNESGKSTLLKFIHAMFYGVSKNKNGKEISDYDRYTPWNSEEFSGKVNYVLDNGKSFEVFREFSKKNPKIYNENLEDISKQFNIDKNKGNQFFYDQTKIDDVLFLSTNIVEQNEVVLDKNNQNLLTQKIANILSTGEDNTSYNKVIEKLSKRLIEDVGTERTVGRPLNEVQYEIENLNRLKKEYENLSNINTEIKDNKEEIEKEIKNIEKELELLKDIKNIKEKEKNEKEKININKKITNDYIEKINSLKSKISNNKKEKTKNNKGYLILISILVILNILINLFNISKTIKIVVAIISIISLALILIKIEKNKRIKKEINIEKIKIEKEIEVLEENKSNNEKEIEKTNEIILEDNRNNLIKIKNEYNGYFNDIEIERIFNEDLININEQIELLNREYNSKQIELNTIKIKEKEINNKIQNKIECEEKLEYYKEQKKEILDLERSIKLAKSTLEIAYNEIKNEITPKFTKDLNSLIEKISNGKYKNTKFDSEYGLRVERENGEYIDCNMLSIGTIDQLYLSLRLSAMNEISEEKMPIILDEAFAYYDNERLENILKYICEDYKNNQILIFTCSNREKEILNKLNIEYNLVDL